MLLKKAENAESAISEKHDADSSEEKSAKALPDENRHAFNFNAETRPGRICPNLKKRVKLIPDYQWKLFR